jgi:hypothetical protein
VRFQQIFLHVLRAIDKSSRLTEFQAIVKRGTDGKIAPASLLLMSVLWRQTTAFDN